MCPLFGSSTVIVIIVNDHDISLLQLEQPHALYPDSEYKLKQGSCGKQCIQRVVIPCVCVCVCVYSNQMSRSPIFQGLVTQQENIYVF